MATDKPSQQETREQLWFFSKEFLTKLNRLTKEVNIGMSEQTGERRKRHEENSGCMSEESEVVFVDETKKEDLEFELHTVEKCEDANEGGNVKFNNMPRIDMSVSHCGHRKNWTNAKCVTEDAE